MEKPKISPSAIYMISSIGIASGWIMGMFVCGVILLVKKDITATRAIFALIFFPAVFGISFPILARFSKPNPRG
jgi:uncharacterized protein YqhQ